MNARGPLSHPGAGTQAPVSQLGSLGVSAANLGGSGAGNTLVLVNGRRMAGAAGIEDGFVNLNAIPLSAIERVEIDMDGSSAVYGADAIGGVINFILKRNYTGTTFSAKHEFSANDASVTSLSIASGMAWDRAICRARSAMTTATRSTTTSRVTPPRTTPPSTTATPPSTSAASRAAFRPV
jgi:iron complex outermembrane receptor protein